MNNIFETWVSRIKEHHPKANDTVLRFIFDFLNLQTPKGHHDDHTASDIIYNQFASGYCYYFAQMLKTAFHRGEICWAAPFGHIVWVDDNEVAYDISGCNDSECKYYVPIFMLGNMIKDFMHVPNDAYNASEQEIANAVLEWDNVVHTDPKSKKPEDADVIHMNDAIAIVEWLSETKDLHTDIIDAKRKYIALRNEAQNRNVFEERIHMLKYI